MPCLSFPDPTHSTNTCMYVMFAAVVHCVPQSPWQMLSYRGRGRAAARRRRRPPPPPAAAEQTRAQKWREGGGSQRRIHFSCEVGGPFPPSPPQSFYFFSPSFSSFFLFFLFHVRWQFPLPFFPVFLSCVYSVSAISDEKSVLIKSKI